jgi:hypothetical protein
VSVARQWRPLYLKVLKILADIPIIETRKCAIGQSDQRDAAGNTDNPERDFAGQPVPAGIL